MAQLREEIRALISEIAEVDTIPDDTHFKDLGIDSMMGVEIVAAIERQYQIKIPDEELKEISTLNKSYEIVLSKLPEEKRARFVA
jgi:acyl carrier protein